MYSGEMFSGVTTLIVIGLVATAMAICFGCYKIYTWITPNEFSIESKYLITPQIKLHTDGVKIDTTYIYKTKK